MTLLTAISPNQTAVLVNFVVDKVHANHASQVFLVAAGLKWICRLFGPSKRAFWHVSVIVVGVRIHTEPSWGEPASTMCLLTFDDN